MLRILYIAIIVFLFAAYAPAPAQKVLVVDDDTYSKPDHFPKIFSSILSKFPNVEQYTSGADDSLDIDRLQSYDLVIWYCGNSGIGLEFWNKNDTDNAAVAEYLAQGGSLWIIGNDVLYDRYGNAPVIFSENDFPRKFLGIDEYLSQSKTDDNDRGVPYMESHNQLFPKVLRWLEPSLWFVDGCKLSENAMPIYAMGDEMYSLYGQLSMMSFRPTAKSVVLSTLFDPWFIADEYDNFMSASLQYIEQNMTYTGFDERLDATASVKYSGKNIEIGSVKYNLHASVYTLFGNKIIAQDCGAGDILAISTHDLPHGMYFVIVSDDSGNIVTTEKIVR